MQASETGTRSEKKNFLSSTFFRNYSGSIGVSERQGSADKDTPCPHHLYDNFSSSFHPALRKKNVSVRVSDARAADVTECEEQKRSSRQA